jgi:hypothetical protein
MIQQAKKNGKRNSNRKIISINNTIWW